MAKSFKIIDNGYTPDEDAILEIVATLETALAFIKIITSIFPVSSIFMANYIEKLKLFNSVSINIPYVNKKINIKLDKANKEV